MPAAAVTGVAVLSNHRRQGHLTRLMDAELHHAADAGCRSPCSSPPSTRSTGASATASPRSRARIRLDTTATRFLDEPTGTITLVDPPSSGPRSQQAYEARWARTPGAIDAGRRVLGPRGRPRGLPGPPVRAGQAAGAIWHDDERAAAGRRRLHDRGGAGPTTARAGVAEVEHLLGATPEAERELWRHLLTVDWVRHGEGEQPGGGRSRSRSGSTTAGPPPTSTTPTTSGSASSTSRPPSRLGAGDGPGAVVLEVVDPLGFAAGRWSIELGPDGGAPQPPTTERRRHDCPSSALGATLLGGHTVDPPRPGRSGVDEERPGGLDRATALLQTPTAPWSPRRLLARRGAGRPRCAGGRRAA